MLILVYLCYLSVYSGWGMHPTARMRPQHACETVLERSWRTISDMVEEETEGLVRQSSVMKPYVMLLRRGKKDSVAGEAVTRGKPEAGACL